MTLDVFVESGRRIRPMDHRMTGKDQELLKVPDAPVGVQSLRRKLNEPGDFSKGDEVCSDTSDIHVCVLVVISFSQS